jgi:hypothetical protein
LEIVYFFFKLILCENLFGGLFSSRLHLLLSLPLFPWLHSPLPLAQPWIVGAHLLLNWHCLIADHFVALDATMPWGMDRTAFRAFANRRFMQQSHGKKAAAKDFGCKIFMILKIKMHLNFR